MIYEDDIFKHDVSSTVLMVQIEAVAVSTYSLKEQSYIRIQFYIRCVHIWYLLKFVSRFVRFTGAGVTLRQHRFKKKWLFGDKD